MGQLLIATEKSHKGPWLLDNTALINLHEIVEKIDGKLKEAYEVQLNQDVTKELKEKNLSDSEYEKTEQKIISLPPYTKQEKTVLLVSSDGKKLKDNTLIGVLKDQKNIDFSPKSLEIDIRYGPVEFSFKVPSQVESDDGYINYRIKVENENFINDIIYELESWINGNRPKEFVQWWISLYPLIVISFIISGLIFLLQFSPPDPTSDYQTQLKKDGIALVEKGITEQNQYQATDLLLKLNTGYIPKNYSISKNQLDIKFLIINFIIVLASFVLLFRPKTIIGIGKKTEKVKFYQMWIKVITVFIPGSIILPFIVNILPNYLKF